MRLLPLHTQAARRKYTTRRCGRNTDAPSVRPSHWSSRTDEASVLRVEYFLRAALRSLLATP